jgi:WD40 repeat protein
MLLLLLLLCIIVIFLKENGCSDGTIKIWEAETGSCLHTLHGHTSRVWDVSSAPSGLFLASASGDATAMVPLPPSPAFDTHTTRHDTTRMARHARTRTQSTLVLLSTLCACALAVVGSRSASRGQHQDV